MKNIQMKKNIIYGIAGAFIALLSLSIISCEKTSVVAPILTAANFTDTIPAAGGTKTLLFNCNDTKNLFRK